MILIGFLQKGDKMIKLILTLSLIALTSQAAFCQVYRWDDLKQSQTIEIELEIIIEDVP
jgi:hypothetical protein